MKKKLLSLIIASSFLLAGTVSAQPTRTEDGWRRICPEDLRISLELPAEYTPADAPTAYGLSFEDGEGGAIMIDAAPKTDSAGMTAWYDYAARLERIDTEKAQFDRIIPCTYATVDAFSYQVTAENAVTRYLFFASGDYMYRITITGSEPMAAERERGVMNSIIARPPKKELAAELTYFLPRGEELCAAVNDCSFTIPNGYTTIPRGRYYHRMTGAVIELSRTGDRNWDKKASRKHIEVLARSVEKNGAVILRKPAKTTIGKIGDCFTYTAQTPEGLCEYGMSVCLSGDEFLLRAQVPAIYATEHFQQELESIMASVHIKN